MSREYADYSEADPPSDENRKGKRYDRISDSVPFSEDELLARVRSEREDSVGFDNDGDELIAVREKALEYYKGEVPDKDLPKLPNRSQVVSTDVAEAVETFMPDLMEVFFGGDDILAFRPTGEEDVERADQETQALRQVALEENPGFENFAHAIKDALITRIGVWHLYWKDAEYDTQEREGNVLELQGIAQGAEEFEILEEPETPDGVYKVRVKVLKHAGMACYEPLPGEDFAIARDAKSLREATYAAHRARPRIQDLIADGYDEQKVRSLPPYAEAENEEISWDRDFADEGEIDVDGHGDLAKVEAVYHVIKLLHPETKELQHYRVVTGQAEGVLLDAEPIDYMPYAGFTPFMAPHRFYGQSVAEKLFEIQKIKTNLLRLMLDQGAYAVNNRHEVVMSKASEFTISDLIRNIPGAPVRVREEGAVRPLQGGSLAFDVLGAMETVSVMGEQRTGMQRYSQGLKADTLHETARGAMEMAQNAMKRVRYMARTIAEMGVKDLFLTLHTMMRLHSTHQFKLRLGERKFVDVDPTAWGNRQDMTIEIGIGSGGRQEKIENLNAVGDMMGAAIQYQQSGGIDRPVVTTENVHAFYEMAFKARGIRAPEKLLSDPEQQQAPQQPQGDPAMAEMAAKQQEAQAKLQLDAQKAQTDAELGRMKIEQEAQLKREQMEAEFALKREQMAAEMQLKREQMAGELALKERMGAGTGLNGSAEIKDVRPGGDVG